MKGKIDRDWTKFKTAVLRSKDVTIDLSILKSHSHPKLVFEWLPNLCDLEKIRRIVAPSPAPHDHSSIVNKINVIEAGIDTELAWAAGVVQVQHQHVANWLMAGWTIEQLAFRGHFPAAISALDQLEERIGMSLWGIDMRLFLLAGSEGIEAQKNFAKQLRSDSTVPDLVHFYTYYSSLRCEPRISCWRYDTHIQQVCDGIDADNRSDAEQFFAFLVNFFGPTQFVNVGNTLWRHGTLPAIDLYLAFVRCCTLLASTTLQPNTTKILKLVITSLRKSIPDPRLNAILIHLGEVDHLESSQTASRLMHCLDCYTAGDYAQSAKLGMEALNESPNQFEFAEIVAKSLARPRSREKIAVDPPETREVIKEMVEVLTKSTQVDKAINSLRKRAYVLPHSTFSAQLFGFCHREFTSDGFTFSRHHVAYADLGSSPYNPRLSLSIGDPIHRKRYLTALSRQHPGSPTLRLYESVATGTKLHDLTRIDGARATLFEARRLIRMGNAGLAIPLLRGITNSSDPLLSQDVVLSTNRSAILTNDWALSIRSMAKSYVNNPAILSRLPLAEVLNRVQSHPAYDECSSDIGLAILAQAYCQHTGSEFETLRDNAYEEFLERSGVEKPSKLASFVESFECAELSYFLRHVCIESVLDNSIVFTSTEDLQNERIAIYRLLIEIDPANLEHDSEQIKEITKSLVVRRAVHQVEQSGIHVEVAGIKRAIEKSLREGYSRFLDLCGETSGTTAADLLVRIGKALGADAQRLQIFIPGDERLTLLKEMFMEVRDQFVSSNEFGLDGYLSTGMRHGTLSGQVRAPFEKLNLITQRDDATNVYREPQTWLERYPQLKPADKHRFSESIQSFSRDIDSLIDRTRTQWIQIRTERSDGEGMFDFRISDIMTAELQRAVGATTRYEDFVDLVFSRLWQITDRSLELVREKLTVDFKNEITTRVGRLEHEIQELLGTGSNTEVLAAITRARTESQYAVDKIANWFKRAPTPDMEPYALDLPVSIASEMMRNLFPNCQLTMTVAVESELRLSGKTLKGLVQVLFILFENVKKHSGIVGSAIPVAIGIRDSDHRISLEVTSEVNPTPPIDMRKQQLDDVLKSVERRQRFESVPLEGGSGLQKIERILRVDLNCDPLLSFAFDADNKFRASITLVSTNLVT